MSQMGFPLRESTMALKCEPIHYYESSGSDSFFWFSVNQEKYERIKGQDECGETYCHSIAELTDGNLLGRVER